MGTVSALAMCEQIKAAMAAAGYPRTSKMNGGQMTGWTNAIGSTGWSCFQLPENEADRRFSSAPSEAKLMWHVILSGKPHLKYTERPEYEDGESITMHEPQEPEKLFGTIKSVFEKLGFQVYKVRTAGWQGHWDDDVQYNVYTDHPESLERTPHYARPQHYPEFQFQSAPRWR